MVLDPRYSEVLEQLVLRKTFFWLDYVFLGNLEKLIPELFTKLSQFTSLLRILLFLFYHHLLFQFLADMLSWT